VKADPLAPIAPNGNGNGNHVAPIAPANPDDGLVKILLNRLLALEERLQAPPAAATIAGPAPKLNAAQTIAYEAAAWARQCNPELVTDFAVFKWLAGQERYRRQLPPTAETFRRYLMTARRIMDGCTKREARREELKPPPKAG
jgi:hypothetical protein